MTVTKMKCDQGVYLGVCFSDCVNQLEIQGHTRITNVKFSRLPEGKINYQEAANEGVYLSDTIKCISGLR